MIKPSTIKGKTFDVVKNGYDPESVERFLSEIADYVTELINTNADNEEKIVKLVEKINEYRDDEEAIKTTMISAQKEANRVLNDAKEKAENMIESAKTEQVRIAEQNASECDRIIREHKEKCAQLIKENTEATQNKILAVRKAYDEEKTAFDSLKAEITYFKSDLTELYKKQLLLIMDIPELDAADLEKYEQEIADKAAAEQAEKENELEAEIAAKKAEAEADAIEEQQEKIDEILNTGSFEPVIPKSNYNDLKFGKNN